MLFFVFSGVKGHSGYSGCMYCHQHGRYLLHRIVFDTNVGQPRTHDEFIICFDRDHHVGHCPFVHCKFIFDIISSFPPEPMHLVDLGVVCKIFTQLKGKKLLNIELADAFITQMVSYIPNDFTRRPRSFLELEHYKATEFRLLALYIAPIILFKACHDQKITAHFLLLYVAYRLLMGEKGSISPDNLDMADAMIRKFVNDFPDIYGEEQVSFNVHALLHLVEFARKYGPIDQYSAYRYENWYQLLRKWIRKSSHYFQQVFTRWNQMSGKMKRKTTTKFGSYDLKSNKKDCCILLHDERVAIIKKITRTVNGPQFSVQTYRQKESLFEYPISSSHLNIYKVNKLETSQEIILPSAIMKKMLRIPFEDSFVTIPMLHEGN